MNELDYTQKTQIEELLLGRTIRVVDDHTVTLDNGTVLELPDTDGGCACNAGCYDLVTLQGIDNIITKVEFVDDPAGDDDHPDKQGIYQIFVYAQNEKVNLATWKGSDGNGYYGTGYLIRVRPRDDEGPATDE
jgi:hypothetical protein